MALPGAAVSELPPSPQSPVSPSGVLRKLFRWNGRNSQPGLTDLPQDKDQNPDSNDSEKPDLINRMSRKVVPELPRAQTFKRQQSERRDNLTPVEPTPDERRAVSVDRRSRGPRASSPEPSDVDPRTSAPGILYSAQEHHQNYLEALAPASPTEDLATGHGLEQLVDDEVTLADECGAHDNLSTADTHSLTASQYGALIHEELEKKWILNLSMHFRDRSRREKFFVTYREDNTRWRRVTVSLDYRNAPPDSLEMDLIQTQFQREKSAKIYEAIRDSLADIQFYETVTNLKLQTTGGRLHVHVVEDGNEIIHYPLVSQVDHLGCRRFREQDIMFDSHMSGFVYKVNVNGQVMIKKEIPSPDTVDEFMYEVNALSHLGYSSNVIQFYGVVVDNEGEHIKGLLISFAEQGALIDMIYEECKEQDVGIPWTTREKWARQIVEGLSDIHESGFVQGDFTLSNIVIDSHHDAKIIDINRRGCPVGWEPPEATPLIDRNQRISMYIGVKSDLYQLGMVLWALAAQEDEPEAQGRPLILGPEVNIPDWYRRVAEICLSNDPRMRVQASSLLQMFPPSVDVREPEQFNPPPPSSTDDGYLLRQYLVDGYQPDELPQIRTVEQPSDWSYVGRPYTDASPGYGPYYYTRGRSPPSPITTNYGRYDSAQGMYDIAAWAANRDIPSSYSDVEAEEAPPQETPIAENLVAVECGLQAQGRDLANYEDNPGQTVDAKETATTDSPIPQMLADLPDEKGEALKIRVRPEDSLPVRDVVGDTVTGIPEATELDSENTPTMGTNVPDTRESSVTTGTDTLQRGETQGAEQDSTTGTISPGEHNTEMGNSGLPSDAPGHGVQLESLHQTLITAHEKTPRDRIENAKSEYVDMTTTAGNTVPNAKTNPVERNPPLKTITPPSTCGGAEDRIARSDGGPLSDKGREVQETNDTQQGAEVAKAFNPLNGIGAAHLTSHDDIMQKKELLDDDFTPAALPAECGSPMITTTDAKT